MRNNRPFVISGLNAAILRAELEIGNTRPGGMKVHPTPTIQWDEAPQEMRDDPNIIWITREETEFVPKAKYAFRSHTEQEKKEIELNKRWRLAEMFNYILENYGWRYALKFYEHSYWRKKFEEAGVVPNFQFPHCEYEESGQCDLECSFFKGTCCYEERRKK